MPYENYNTEKLREFQKAKAANMTVKAYKAMKERNKVFFPGSDEALLANFPDSAEKQKSRGEALKERVQSSADAFNEREQSSAKLRPTGEPEEILDAAQAATDDPYAEGTPGDRGDITTNINIADEHDAMMKQEYDKQLPADPAKAALGKSETEYVGDWLGKGTVTPGSMFYEGKQSPSSEEYLARPPAEDVGREHELDRIAREGFMPPSLEEEIAAGEQSDAQALAAQKQLDEESPQVQQMKELMKDPEAKKEMFKDMSKEDTALAKEEYGNYWVDPNSGYAINLDTVEADSQRQKNWLILQQVPAHQRPRMMANLGFIDPEDVENLPDDPTVAGKQIEADGLMARAKLLAKTDLTKLTSSQKHELGLSNLEIKAQEKNNDANRALRRELDISSKDMQKLQLNSNEWMFLKGQKLKKYMSDRGYELDEKQLTALVKNQESQIDLGYAKIGSTHKLQEELQTFQRTQWKDKLGIMNKQEKRAATLEAFNMSQKTLTWAMTNGQPDIASMTLGFPVDRAGYWKSMGKTSGMNNPAFDLAMSESSTYRGMKPDKVLDKYANEKIKIHAKLRNPDQDDMGRTELDRWIMNDKSGGRGKLWDQMSPSDQEKAGGWSRWHATKMSEAVNDGLRNSTFGDRPDGTPGIHTALVNRTIEINKPIGGGGGDDKKKTPPEKGDETTETKVEPPAIVKTQEGAPGRVPKEIPAAMPGGQTVKTTTKNFEDKLRTLTNKAVERRKRNPGYGAKVPDLIKRGKGKLKKIFGTRDVNDFDSKNNSESKLLKFFKENPEKIDEMDDAVQMYIYNKLLNK